MPLDTTVQPSYPMPKATGCPFDPPPELRELRAAEPLSRVRLWDGSTPWLVTHFAHQRALLADDRVSADRNQHGFPILQPSIPRTGSSVGFISMDDPEHARLRRMVTAPFMIKRVRAMEPGVQQIVDDLIDAMLAGPRPADLMEAFALPVPSLAICQLLGVPYDDHEFFQVTSKALITIETPLDERMAARERLTAYLDDLVGRKTTEPGDDVLTELAARVTAGELTREQAAGIGVLLLVAGHETTANMIALGTLALLEHPDQLEALRNSDDPAVVNSAVEELLRFLTITHLGLTRVALEDIELAGQTIRAGDGIVFPNDIANRDPEVFPDPDRLDLRRDAKRHVGFGFGIHQCLGQPLARMELRVVYSTLYRRIPTLRRAAPLTEIPFKHDAIVYGVHALPVTW
ncbi:cytochrome P450 [Kribbella sp. CA-253562]|uniref:cytochrome P450 n=1 Tax=Kribbella sp. CA-253562 TaxID=3239942 RepID=UPI003D93FDA7